MSLLIGDEIAEDLLAELRRAASLPDRYDRGPVSTARALKMPVISERKRAAGRDSRMTV
jgi:hypothetical protein